MAFLPCWALRPAQPARRLGTSLRICPALLLRRSIAFPPLRPYRFIGKVTGENEEGIPGIRVAVKMSADWTGAYVERDGNMVPYIWEHADTLFTDEKGEFARQYALLEDIESIPKHVQMKVEDIDGEENGGTFATQEGISMDVKQVEEGSGHWNMGTYESQADIKMKKE